MKSKISQTSLNKNQILQWINRTLDCNQTKIQSLGNGIIYCLLMNHFYPNSIPKNKILMVPRNNMDNKTNLRKVQEAFNLLNIKSINFDIFRVSEMSYLDNWQFISKLHRHFDEVVKNAEKQTEKCHQSNQTHNDTRDTSQNISQTLSQNISQNLNQSVSQSISQMINQNHTFNQNISQPLHTLNQNLNQSQPNYMLSKQISKSPDFNIGLLTPMKGLKYFDQNTKLRCEALKIMQDIKTIVKSETQSDKLKVKTLKKMLGLIEQQSQQQQLQLKQLFSDCKNKQQVITID